MKSFAAISFVVLLIVPFASFAGHRLAEQRNIVFDRIGTDEGLSQATASSFAQDAQGYIWVGTQEGLNRYDGLSFKTYYHDDESELSISHDSIWSLFLSAEDVLWVGTAKGLSRYDSQGDNFNQVKFPTTDSEQVGPIYDITEDSDGTMWVASASGLFAISKNGDLVDNSFWNRSDQTQAIRSLHYDSKRDGLWVGSEHNGLYFLEISTKSVVSWQSTKDGSPLLMDKDVRDIVSGPNDRIWIATFNGGLTRLEPESLVVEHFPIDLSDPKALATNRIRSLLLDRDENIWVGTDVGLHLFDGEGQFMRFQHDLTNPRSISENTVHDLFQDNGGVIWLATYDGVNKWNANIELFPFFKRPIDSLDLSPSTNVTSFTEDQEGDVWIGTLSGLLVWDNDHGTLKSKSPTKIGLADQRVMSLETMGENVWVGTMNGGVSLLSGRSVSETMVRTASDYSLSSNSITGFFVDSHNRMWVTTWGGGVNLYLGSGQFQRFPFDDSPEKAFADLRAHDIVEVSPQTYWIATDGGGIVILDSSSGNTTHIREATSDLVSDNIITLLKTEFGIWIGSVDQGLGFFDFKSKSIRSFTKKDGLASDAIYGLLEDEEGKIWISSAKGLTVYDPILHTFASFNTTHGLQSSDFNSGAYAKLSDGSLAFGGISGFNVFYPSNIQQNSFVPPVVFTDFKLFNQSTSWGKLIEDNSLIELDHSDSVFSISFAALDFTAPEQNKYRYRLEGFDRGWVQHEGSPEVTYTNLDAGEYVFRVQGSNSDGVWNKSGASIPIRVLPAPWLSWWAFCVYALLVIALLVVAVRVNSKRLERDAERRYSEQLQLYIESLEEASDSILIANSQGTLIYANNTVVKGLNRTPSEVIGESLWGVLFQNEADTLAARRTLSEDGRFHGEVNLKIEDELLVQEVTIAAVQQSSRGDLAYVGISRDVTDRKHVENQLEDYRKNLEQLVEDRTHALQKEIAENKAIQLHLADSLQEKELLIKEVHHRVKNNMQVISSLLSIQAEGVKDDVYSNLLNESQQRIKSMALIHETLYQSKDLLKIDFQEYIETLTTSLSRSYSVPGVSVHVDVNVENVLLDLETAVPCGLVINELVSNSLKHAFRGKDGIGMIDIDFVTNDCHYDLRIADNGVGLPEGFDPTKNVSMGMEIVSILTSQLEGDLTARTEGGAVFEIKFPRMVNA